MPFRELSNATWGPSCLQFAIKLVLMLQISHQIWLTHIILTGLVDRLLERQQNGDEV